MDIRHKNHKQENFSVGLLMKKELQDEVMKFYKLARSYDDIADNPKLTSEQKLKLLEEQKPENKHLQNLLIAFKKDAIGYEYKTWEDLLDYCKHSAVPVGRFMLELHKETIEADELCAVLQIVNHVQDIKYDLELLDRLYVPQFLMEKYHLTKDDFKQNKSSPEVKQMIAEILGILKEMLAKDKNLYKKINDRRLRIEVCIITSLTNIMIKRIERGDVLAKHIKLSKLDWAKAFVSGFIKGF